MTNITGKGIKFSNQTIDFIDADAQERLSVVESKVENTIDTNTIQTAGTLPSLVVDDEDYIVFDAGSLPVLSNLTLVGKQKVVPSIKIVVADETISPEGLLFEKGDNVLLSDFLTVDTIPENQSIRWSSSDTSLVVINDNAYAKAQYKAGVGHFIVTMTYNGVDYTDTFPFIVLNL